MKKIAPLILCCILIHVLRVYAQQQFQISYSPYPHQQGPQIINANGGGYLMASNVTLSSGEKAIMFTRINDQFSIVWNKLINEPGVGERINYFYQDSIGNIFIAGYIDGAVWKALTIKTDSSANLIWKYIYNYGTHSSYASRIYKSNTGSVYVTGFCEDTVQFGPTNVNMALLMKLNSSGVLQWAKTYPGGIYASFQGEILPTTDAKFVVTGTDGSLNISYTNIIQYDTSGTILWKHRSPTVDYAFPSSATGLNQTVPLANGNYLLFGSTNVALSNSYERNYITLCNSSGNMIQSRVFTLTVNSFQRFISYLSVIQTPDGGYAISGNVYGGGIVLLKMNSTLGQLWGRLYAGSNFYNSNLNTLLRCTDGGYLIAAGSYPQDSAIVLIKTDSLGWSSCNETSVNMVDSSFTFPPLTPYTDVQFPLLSQSIYNGLASAGTTAFNTDSLCNIITGYSEENISSWVSIFPNPFSISTTIKIYDVRFRNYDFVLYDLMGKEVMQQEIRNAKTEIQRNNLNSGIYFYKVTRDKRQGSEIIGTGKIIIE